MEIHAYLEDLRRQVDEQLDRLLPSAEAFPPRIHEAMRYSLFAGGKRLRPILCLESSKLFGADPHVVLPRASALEMIHTYSLIHDDLPALDNDDLRRGKPTCHRVFGEAMAILAGDALLTFAFETLSSPGPPAAEVKTRVAHELAQAIGTRDGMVGGQVVDLESSKDKIDAARLKYIHSSKTGALIRMALRAGALYAGAPEEDVARLSDVGAKAGLAFQIADDLLDEEASTDQLGKTAGKDKEQHKATYPALYGVADSRRRAQELVAEACEALQRYGERAQRLQELAHVLVERSS